LARGIRKAGNFASGKRPNSDINVTPLVDVVLVLLIIFMVVTPLLEKDIEVRLPEEQDEHQELPPDQQSQLMVQISSAGEVALNSQHLSLDELGEQLTKALRAKPRGERLVFFLPEEQANYGVVVKALDIAKTSGADILGMVTTDLSAQQPTAASAPP
jgi:biopolymer transport protein ExbD/biopolymer transport protein TolR